MKSGVLSVSVALVLMSTTAHATQYFEDHGTAPFEDLIHWTNYLQLADVDGDHDLDVIFANCTGFFNSSPGAEPLLVYRNNGAGAFTNTSGTAVGNLVMPVRQFALGDVDGDGDLDMYVPHAGGGENRFYINDGSGVFTDEAAVRLPGVSSRAGAVRFGDVDNDGDLDLLVADGYGIGIGPRFAHLYLNDGGVFSEDAAATPTMVHGFDPDDIDLLDVDRDFDLDVLINVHAGKSVLWINDGAGRFTDASSKLAAMPGGADKFDGPFHYGPAVCDVDGDGDLDIWTDNVAPPYAEQLMINDGQGNFADETSARVSGNAASADDNGLACIDLDGDGDFDVAIMSLSDVERILINDGTGHFIEEDEAFPSVNDSTLWFDFGDLDNDGRLDVVTGQGESSERRNRLYLANGNVAADTRAPTIIAVEQVEALDAADTPVVRYAVSDAVVTDTGPRLSRAYLKVEAGATQEVEAVFSGGDLFRAVLPAFDDGTVVSYTACAVDRRNNEGCAAPLSYTVGEPAGTGGGGQGAGGGGATGGGMDGGAGGGSDSFDPGEGDGCGCEAPGRSGGSPWWLLGLLVLWQLTPRARRTPGARPR